MISEHVKIDQAIYPQSVSSAGTTGIYFNLQEYAKACFAWNVALGVNGLTATSTGLIYEATSKNGAGTTSITATSTVVYASSNLTLATITPATTISAADTVTINGITFTALSANDTAHLSSQTFNVNTSNASTTITNLVSLLNDATYGIGTEGLYASATTTTCTIRFAEPGDPLEGDYDGIVLTSSSTTNLTLAAIAMQGIIEIDGSKLTLSSNFTHVALNVINTSANYTSAVVIRSGARYNPTHIDPVTRV